MRRNKVIQEMIIAVGVAAGVMAIGFVLLIGTAPMLASLPASSDICVLDRVLVFERSAIAQQANAELVSTKNRLQSSINSEKALIDRATGDRARSQQMGLLVEKVRAENAQLETLRRKASSMVIQRIAPIIRRDAHAARCAIVLDRSALVDAGKAVDLTSLLVKDIGKELPPAASAPPDTEQ